MTVSAANFFGGAQSFDLSGSTVFSLHPKSPRSCRVNCTSSLAAVRLPDARHLKPGAMNFVLSNVGTNLLTVRDRANATVGAVSPGNTAYISLVSNSTQGGAWVMAQVTSDTPRVASVSGSPVAPSEAVSTSHPTYNPECGDPCNPNVGTAPAVPMWINSALVALNENRDPIRGADLSIARQIEITISSGFSHDSNHTSPGVSAELLEKLSGTHILTWDGNNPVSQQSRHPHHIQLKYDSVTDTWSWEFPTGQDIPVFRLFWTKTISYSSGGMEYELELRFVVEWAYNVENGLPHEEEGAFGSLMNFYAFSTEVNPDYVDLENDPDQHNIPFSREDPLVYGPLYPGTSRMKYAHPQMLFAACIPTTFQSPALYTWYHPSEEYYRECYRVGNGAPWTSTPAKDAATNSVFRVINQSAWRAMTIGGDVPTSELYPLVTIENGAGYGLTALKPSLPGWDEASGELTDGSDISLTDCPVDQSSNAVDVCEGHPDTPYVGVGGTHRCWKSGNEELVLGEEVNPCCISIGPVSKVDLVRKCCDTAITFDGTQIGEACQASDLTVSVHEVFHTKDMDFVVANYTMGTSGRDFRWWKGVGDPDYEVVEMTNFPNVDGNTVEGAFSLESGTITCISDGVGAAFTPGAAYEYVGSPTIATHHFRFKARIVFDQSTPPAGHNAGLAARSVDVIGQVYRDRIAAVVYRSGGGNPENTGCSLQIVLYKDDVRTVLAQLDNISPVPLVGGIGFFLEFEGRGTILKARIISAADLSVLAEVEGASCALTQGGVLEAFGEVGCLSAQWSDFTYVDLNAETNPGDPSGNQIHNTVRIYNSSGELFGEVFLDQRVDPGYPYEACQTTAGCGEPPCEAEICHGYQINSSPLSFTAPLTGYTYALNDAPEELRHCLVGSDCIHGTTCTECEVPFRGVVVTLPGRCTEADPEYPQHKMCAGFEAWFVAGCFGVTFL